MQYKAKFQKNNSALDAKVTFSKTLEQSTTVQH